MSTDDENVTSDLPPVPVELEEQTAPVGEEASGEELPPLPPGMTKDDTTARPAPVLRPQPVVSPAVPQSTPYPQAQKPKGKGAMVVLILALIACAMYQGAQAWQAKQTETEAKEKIQQNATAEAKAIQQAKDTQAHADRIAGLVKSKHEADEALESVQTRRRDFQATRSDDETRLESRSTSAKSALEEVEKRKSELEEQLKEGRHE